MLLAASCAGGPGRANGSAQLNLDQAIEESAIRTLALVPAGDQRTLAVYYFTTGEQENELSDYIANGLTTELANRAGSSTSIVSRQALDRLMQEYSYQLTDLVDREGQVSIGQQLGADLILTGFITPSDDHGLPGGRLNAQLIEVASARVLGGFVLDFRVPKGLALAGPPADQAASSTGRATTQHPRFTGVATVTTIFEDFESGVADMALGREASYWGDRVRQASAESRIASEDGQSHGLFIFKAAFDHTDLLSDWEESDAGFYARIDTGQAPDGYDGLAIRLRPGNSSLYTLNLVQQTRKGEIRLWQHLQLNNQEWQDLKLAFSVFVPDERGMALDPGLPVQLEFYASFMENHQQFHLREGMEVEARLAVDDIGFFQVKSPDPPDLIQAFEDEVNRLPLTVEIYGSDLYTEYQDEGPGITHRNSGIGGQSISMQVLPDGPAGSYLQIAGTLAVNDAFPGTIPLYLFIRANSPLETEGTDGISFLVRSSLGSQAYLEIQDDENEGYYQAGFGVMETWSRIRIPFRAMDLESSQSLSSHVRLVFTLELEPEELRRAVRDGQLAIELGLDEVRLYQD
jgi:hypothetical protein